MQLSPDGKRLLTVSDDRHARIIEPRAPNDVLFRTTEDQWPLAEEMPYTPVRVWDLATGRELYALNGLRCVVRWASFSPDGRRIATLSSRMEQYSYLQIKNGAATLNSTGGSLVNDRGLPQIHIWDASSGKLLLTISDLQNPDSDAWGSLAWSPDNRSIVVPGIFGVLDLAETRCFVLPGISAGSSALYSPDGRYLLTSIGGEATVFDLSALEPKKGSWGVQLEVRSFRPDGPEAVTTVTRGESRSCRTLKLTGHESQITAVVFSPDSRWIATTSADRTARIWATETGEMSHVLRGHERQVSGSAFSPDSRWLVTTSDDQTARIWELATGTEWLTLKGHQGAVRSAVFSPDGQHVLSASDDGTVRVWPKDPLQVALSRKPRELTTDERARLEIAPVQSPHTVH